MSECMARMIATCCAGVRPRVLAVDVPRHVLPTETQPVDALVVFDQHEDGALDAACSQANTLCALAESLPNRLPSMLSVSRGRRDGPECQDYKAHVGILAVRRPEQCDGQQHYHGNGRFRR